MDRFKCRLCGNCCREFGRDKKEEYPKFINGRVLLLSRPRLMVYTWEKHLFPKDRLSPCEVLFDEHKMLSIIISYTLESGACPNLSKDNTCRVYKDRPIICRCFPCPYSSTSELENRKKLVDVSGICRAELPPERLHQVLGFKIEGDKYSVDNKVLIRKSYARYGDIFLYAFAKNINDNLVTQFIKDLQVIKGFRFASDKTHSPKKVFELMKKGRKADICKLFKFYTGRDLKDNFSESNLKLVKNIISKT